MKRSKKSKASIPATMRLDEALVGYMLRLTARTGLSLPKIVNLLATVGMRHLEGDDDAGNVARQLIAAHSTTHLAQVAANDAVKSNRREIQSLSAYFRKPAGTESPCPSDQARRRGRNHHLHARARGAIQ